MSANLENSSGHRTRKSQCSFQSQRRAMPKNAQTTTQLHSFHMLASQSSKFSKQGFNSMWTDDFHIHKLDLEKAEEPETKLPTSIGLEKKQGNSIKTSSFASLAMLKPFTLWITTVENSWRDGNTRPTCFLRNMYGDQETTVKTGHGKTDWFKIQKQYGPNRSRKY